MVTRGGGGEGRGGGGGGTSLAGVGGNPIAEGKCPGTIMIYWPPTSGGT